MEWGGGEKEVKGHPRQWSQAGSYSGRGVALNTTLLQARLDELVGSVLAYPQGGHVQLSVHPTRLREAL